MKQLFGVMSTVDSDVLYTYEADSAEGAARLYLEDADGGDAVRVFLLARHPPAFVKTSDDQVLHVAAPPPVRKG